jgi:F-type H+-transporting ATPase subunit delta
MAGTVLSRRYARALAEVAAEQGILERVRSELDALRDGFAHGRFEVRFAGLNMSREEKLGVCRELAVQLGLSRPTGRLLELLVDKRRLVILDDLAASYTQEADRRLGIRRAEVRTAQPLGDQEREQLASRLSALTGARVALRERLDASLIAGFQVRIENTFFDGSLRGRLDRFKETITHAE